MDNLGLKRYSNSDKGHFKSTELDAGDWSSDGEDLPDKTSARYTWK